MREIRYNIESDERAEEIVNNFETSEKYLRNLVVDVTGNGKFADSLDYTGLLHEGKKIKGTAEKNIKKKLYRKNL